MFSQRSSLRVRYAETDQMAMAYYGNYAQYFEVARVEALRSVDMPYSALENEGVLMPVLKLEVNYHLPARYDELLTIETAIKELPRSRITFHHRIFNESEELLTTGSVTLAFVNVQTGKPVRCPAKLEQVLKPYFTADKA